MAVRLARQVIGIAGDPVGAQQSHSLREPRVVGHCHPSFGAGDDLDRVEAEHGNVAVAAVANVFAPIAPANRVRCILDDAESVAPPERAYGSHFAWLPTQMHGNHNFRQVAIFLGSNQLLRKAIHAQIIGS